MPYTSSSVSRRRALVLPAVLFLVAFGAAGRARAQSFNAVSPFVTRQHPNSIALGDFDSDGVVDLAVPQYEGGFTLYVGDGVGGFTQGATLACGTCRASVARDFTGDGVLDVAITSERGNSVLLFAGDGAGGFAPGVPFPVGTKPYFLSAGDFNEDGHPDLAVANSSSANISVLLGDGAGHFSPQVPYTVGTTPRSVVPADFDNDGHLDLAVANYDSNTVSVLLGDGTGAFAAPFDVASIAGPYLIAAADLDADGKADLAVPNFKGTGVSILRGDGTAHFTLVATIHTDSKARHVAVGDLNGDGRPDLVVANYGVSSFSVLLNDGSGGFQPPRTTGVGAGPFFTAITDVNADGTADLAVVNRDASTISVMRGDGTGAYTGPVPLKVVNGPRGVAAADFDGDGMLDLALPNYYANSVSVLRGAGNGRALAAVSYPVSRSPWAIAAADVNGDGWPDLAVTNAGANSVSVLLNNGAGGFAAALNFAAGSGPVAIAAADLNGDSRLDLVTANSTGDSIGVLLGDGLGGFAAPVQWTVGATPSAVAVADVTHDGLPDVVAVNNASGTLSILPGDGTGGFGAASSIAAGTGVAGVAIADLTGEGALDLAVTNSRTSAVQLFAGNGSGGFTAAGSFNVGATPLGIASGDFDGDGVADLATADAGANTVSVLRGTGGGAFAAAQHLIAGLYPRAVVAADFTGDGHPDIAMANANSDDAWILVNATGQADLSVSIDDGLTEVSPGESVSYTVLVANHGPADAGSIAVTAALPPGSADGSWTCTSSPGSICGGGGAGSLSDVAFVRAGGAIVYTVTGTLPPTASGSAVATATVANNGGVDGNPANNSASDVDTVGTNLAPVASDVEASVVEDASTPVTLSATDPEGDPLLWSIVEPPAHGSLTGVPPAMTYTPEPDFSGTDAFTYQVNDGRANSNVATVTVTVAPVNDPPLANAQSTTTSQDAPVTIELSGTDVDGDALSYTIVTAPSHGSLGGGAPVVTYTPAAGYTGPDSFTFTVSDGQGASAPATVSITVTEVNHPPTVAQPLPDVTVTDDSTEVVLDLSSTFSDPDVSGGDVLSLAVSANSNPALVTTSVSGNSLRLGLAAGVSGSAAIRVRGTDNQGLYAEDEFAVSVTRPPLNISIADATVVEGNSGTRALNFSLTLSASSTTAVSVPFSVSGVTAQAGTDFTAVSGTIIFNPGITARTISVPIIPDLVDEDDESLQAVLGTATGAAVSRAEAVGTIVDDDTSALSVSDVTVTEGNAGTVQAVFQVSLSRPNSRTVTVDYITGDSTALAGVDYEPSSGTLTFAPGVQAQTIAVNVLGDTLDEANERFTVSLGNATNTTISHGVAYGTIGDDDDPPVVSIADATVTEANASVTATFTVSLSAPTGFTTRVAFATSDGTAIAGADYRALTGTVTFAPGQTTATVNVVILGDSISEASETLFVTLNTPTLLTIGRAQATGTIVDDDTPNP